MKFTPLTTEEVQLFRQRLVLVMGGVVLLLAIVLFRLWYLQIIEGGYYEEVAKGNRIRVIPEAAPRGIIYDRNGEILAFNRPSFNVQIVLEDTPDLNETLRHLALVTDVPVHELRETLRANRHGPRFKPIVLLKDVGRRIADLIDTYQEDLPGVSVSVEPKRLYPTAYLDSHVLGYVGVINEHQLTRLPLSRLTSGRIVGQAGIEREENNVLIGTDGGKQVEVDHVGRELKVLSQPISPVPGADIQLTIDLRLQRYVHSLMQGQKGVVIVSKPRTGEVLAMVSLPDYDPNQFVGGIDDAMWKRLTHSQDKPLINKAVQGLYPPGSTFKMVLVAAALDTGAIDPNTKVNCPGYYRINRHIYYGWKRGGHGEVNMVQAIKESCDVYFYQLGETLGVDTIQHYANMFGFGKPTGIELESEKAGLIPSREWKQRVLGEQWYDGETVSVAIGQSYVTVTPIQLSAYVDTIANRGLWVRPTLIRRITAPDGRVIESDDDLPRASRMLPLAPSVFDIINQGMVDVVNAPHGTGWRARSHLFTVAGKTGTSQVVGRKGTKREDEKPDNKDFLPHALFIGYAPAEDPKVSVVVLVEHGGSGGHVAAPIARKIFEFYNKHVESLESPKPPVQTASSSTGAGTGSGTGSERYRAQLDHAFDGNVSQLRLPPTPPLPEHKGL